MTTEDRLDQWRKNAEKVLGGLAPFQRRTVEYVVERMFDDANPSKRFLVADEVGLGKTFVARGVIAELIRRRVASGDPRVDIVYVCPNAQIANQNVDRLKDVTNDGVAREKRLTLLAAKVAELDRNQVNLIVITPGTSGFGQSQHTGTFRERAMIAAVMRELFPEVPWDEHAQRVFHHWIEKSKNKSQSQRLAEKIQSVFTGSSAVDGSKSRLTDDGRLRADDPILANVRALISEDDRRRAALEEPSEAPDIAFRRCPRGDQYAAIADGFRSVPDARRSRQEPDEVTLWRDRRTRFISELRLLFAHAGIRELKPDLVVLDEFQRFGNLLDGGAATDDAAEPTTSSDLLERDLAEQLFASIGEDPDHVPRVLMLSATPFRAFARGAEGSRAHDELRRTIRFLSSQERVSTVEQLLANARDALLTAGTLDRNGDPALVETSIDAAAKACAELGEALRPIMVRSERIGATEAGDGMLVDRSGWRELQIADRDLESYMFASACARAAGAADVVEYWKSSPDPLSFMSGYSLWKRADAAIAGKKSDIDIAGLADVIRHSDQPLSRRAVKALDPVDLDHDGVRRFLEDLFESGSQTWLWLPPALRYYAVDDDPFGEEDAGVFTKRLVFSSWRLVPRMLAALVSYEQERFWFGAQGGYPEARPRIDFPPVDEKTKRPSALANLLIVVPWSGLAAFGDTRCFAGRDTPLQVKEIIEDAASALRVALAPFLPRPSHGEGDERSVDPAWYWLGPVLLDLAADDAGTGAARSNAQWWKRARSADWTAKREGDPDPDGPEAGAATDRTTGFSGHLAGVREAVHRLGALAPAERAAAVDATYGLPPDDLFDVLAMTAIGAPGTCALRAFRRVGGSGRSEREHRGDAATVAWALRRLFVHPIAGAIIDRRPSGTRMPYWARVLRYGVDAQMQAMLDEYVHMLCDWVGVKRAAERAQESIGIRSATVEVRMFEPDAADDASVLGARVEMRTGYAARFGADKDSEQAEARMGVVGHAFNSPFWPFVMATTSVGQEGLDFHLYSHAVVHWNLPHSPVDLEQREGRVQRRMGHAVRKNVARDFRGSITDDPTTDPWNELFEVAIHEMERIGATADGMVPRWVYSPTDDHAKVERYVRFFPFSREEQRFDQLLREVTTYRLTFGQPRQDDLLRFLQGSIAPTELQEVAARLRVDLRPAPSDPDLGGVCGGA